MFPAFATTYVDENGKFHLYVSLGIDDEGKQIYRNLDLSNLGIEYTYVKNNDKTYDFTLSEKPKKIQCKMIHNKTGEQKIFDLG